MDVREVVQEEAVKAYMSLPPATNATIIAGTGAGKSKIALDIIKKLQPRRILLLTNSENLRDNNWKQEFYKFDAADWWSRTDSECYQTVHRWSNTFYELVIADEIDFAMSPVYSKYFENNRWNSLLGLTGFCTEEKRVLLNQIAPICYEVSTQEMQEQGLLNKSEFIFIEYDLDMHRTIKVPKKAGGFFMTSENDQYKYYHQEFLKSMVVKGKTEREFDLVGGDDKKLKSAEFKFKMMAAKRKSILNNLDSSIKVTKSLLDNIIGATTGNKALVFSALVKQSNKLDVTTYNGTDDNTALLDLSAGRISVLGICRKLNRGENLVGVNYCIKESFDGSETDFQQQHGRLMRLKPDQVAKIIVLVPYFRTVVRVADKDAFGRSILRSKVERFPTQAKNWADRMMASFSNITARTIVMTSDYKLPGGVVL